MERGFLFFSRIHRRGYQRKQLPTLHHGEDVRQVVQAVLDVAQEQAPARYDDGHGGEPAHEARQPWSAAVGTEVHAMTGRRKVVS